MTMKNLKLIIREQVRKHLVESTPLNQNFWRWFGNSKITKFGKPLICYHGTNKKFKIFDIEQIGRNTGNYGHYGYGFYFSTHIMEAKTYGDTIYECYLKIEKPFRGTDRELIKLKENGIRGIDDLSILSIDFDSFKKAFKMDSEIFKFIENVEKYGVEKAWGKVSNVDDNADKLNDITDILDYTTLNKNVHGVPDHILEMLSDLGVKPKLNKGFFYSQSLHWVTNLGNNSEEVTEVIKNLGYDGIWYGSEIVVFDSNKIKSVNNDGSWDINDDDIFS